jgi:riboflavin synthase
MFTGLIKDTGVVKTVIKKGDGIELVISSLTVSGVSKPDDSVAVNGVCLTVTENDNESFTAQAVKETVSRTNISLLKQGSKVNLEPALTVTDRLGGHIVQGHIDGVGEVVRVNENRNGNEFFIKTDGKTARYIVDKGSVCLDGISLTVADVDNNVFRVAVIPHTLEKTTAGTWKPGTKLNIETDIIGRYIEKLLKNDGGLTIEKLTEMGY